MLTFERDDSVEEFYTKNLFKVALDHCTSLSPSGLDQRGLLPVLPSGRSQFAAPPLIPGNAHRPLTPSEREREREEGRNSKNVTRRLNI